MANNLFTNAWKIFSNSGKNTDVTPTNPPTPAPAAAPPAAPDPLAQMAALWKNDPNAPQPVDLLSGSIINPDNKKIADAAAQVDFTAGIDPALMAAVQKGDDPTAIINLINAVAQKTLATSTQIGAATVDQGLQRNNQRLAQALPDRIKQVQLNQQELENPALAHEAAQPMVRMVRSQIAAQNPHMSPEAINKQAEQTMLGFARAVAGTEDAGFRPGGLPQNQQPSQGTDWEAWGGV